MHMMQPAPVAVAHPTRLADFLLWILQHHTAPTTLVICGEQASFVAQLQASLQSQSGTRGVGDQPQALHTLHTSHDHPGAPSSTAAAGGESSAHTPPEYTAARDTVPYPCAEEHPLLSRTLRILEAARTVQLAYCPSVATLRAYLSALPRRAAPTPPLEDVESFEFDPGRRRERTREHHGGAEPATAAPIVALVNVLMLHRHSSAWSAQGLSLALAAAVEAADRSAARLVVFESAPAGSSGAGGGTTEAGSVGSLIAGGPAGSGPRVTEDLVYTDVAAEYYGDVERRGSEGEQEGTTCVFNCDPWEQELPIVNTTTRTFRGSAERELMVRKVKARTVVNRWCRFCALRDA